MVFISWSLALMITGIMAGSVEETSRLAFCNTFKLAVRFPLLSVAMFRRLIAITEAPLTVLSVMLCRLASGYRLLRSRSTPWLVSERPLMALLIAVVVASRSICSFSGIIGSEPLTTSINPLSGIGPRGCGSHSWSMVMESAVADEKLNGVPSTTLKVIVALALSPSLSVTVKVKVSDSGVFVVCTRSD